MYDSIFPQMLLHKCAFQHREGTAQKYDALNQGFTYRPDSLFRGVINVMTATVTADSVVYDKKERLRRVFLSNETDETSAFAVIPIIGRYAIGIV